MSINSCLRSWSDGFEAKRDIGCRDEREERLSGVKGVGTVECTAATYPRIGLGDGGDIRACLGPPCRGLHVR